jgi:hypothetical protein
MFVSQMGDTKLRLAAQLNKQDDTQCLPVSAGRDVCRWRCYPICSRSSPASFAHSFDKRIAAAGLCATTMDGNTMSSMTIVTALTKHSVSFLGWVQQDWQTYLSGRQEQLGDSASHVACGGLG